MVPAQYQEFFPVMFSFNLKIEQLMCGSGTEEKHCSPQSVFSNLLHLSLCPQHERTRPQTHPCTLKPLSDTQTYTPPSVPLSFLPTDSFPLNPFGNWLCGCASIKSWQRKTASQSHRPHPQQGGRFTACATCRLRQGP